MLRRLSMVVFFGSWGWLNAQELPADKAAALTAVEALSAEVKRLSDELWRLSETALREEASAALLAKTLEAEDFRVERGVAGMPTAFTATYGEGRPVIGILAE